MTQKIRALFFQVLFLAQTYVNTYLLFVSKLSFIAFIESSSLFSFLFSEIPCSNEQFRLEHCSCFSTVTLILSSLFSTYIHAVLSFETFSLSPFLASSSLLGLLVRSLSQNLIKKLWYIYYSGKIQ